MPLSLLLEHEEAVARYDLVDTGIDLCSPEVLVQVSDNYDYQHLRTDYLANELVNLELGFRFYIHELRNGYAARISDPRTYDLISRDVVRRWVYPLAPDANFCPALRSGYRIARRHNYREVGEATGAGADGRVSLARTATLRRGCVVGAGCVVGEHAALDCAVLVRYWMARCMLSIVRVG